MRFSDDAETGTNVTFSLSSGHGEMIIASSKIVVLLLGSLVTGLSLWGFFVPKKLLNMVNGAVAQSWGFYLAVIVRLILGAALILVAPESRFPTVLTCLGWFAIVAAVVLVIMGAARLRKLVGWFETTSALAIRIWLVFGAAFGVFLIYAVM